MKSAVILLPGLNRDRDMIAALTKISGQPPVTVWQTETEIPDVDLIVIPGGFSYGDYLRCGAMAAHSPIMRDVVASGNVLRKCRRGIGVSVVDGTGSCVVSDNVISGASDGAIVGLRWADVASADLARDAGRYGKLTVERNQVS